jgi:hypothetical protein
LIILHAAESGGILGNQSLELRTVAMSVNDSQVATTTNQQKL